MQERDKFLAERMGHEFIGYDMQSIILRLKGDTLKSYLSKWNYFGLLWEWVTAQEWYWHFDCHLMYSPSGHEFTKNDSDGYLHKDYISADALANALYEYLKGKN